MNRFSSPAFTLVEVLVVAPLIILFIGAFIGMVVTLTGDSLKLRESNAAAYGVQDALDEMGTASGNALGFLTTTGTLVSPQGSGNNTAAFTNGTNTLILSSAATTKNPFDPTRQLVYQGSGTCSSTNPVYSYTTVYFVSDGSLYKRTILPSSPAACTTPWQKPSCEESRVAANPTVCRASDEKLLDNVAGMTITYYDSASSSTSIPASEAEDAVSVSIQLQASKQVAGDTVSYSGTSRVKRGEGGNGTPTYGIEKLAVEGNHSCAIASGEVYCWGSNYDGQLGDGTNVDKSTPVKVGGLLAGKTATALSGKIFDNNYRSHMCAVADGQVYCWGNNNSGQLGDGSYSGRLTPVLAGGALVGKTVTNVVAAGGANNGYTNTSSGAYTCALADGKAYCWGNNNEGQLGDGTMTERTSPVAVGGALATKTVVAIQPFKGGNGNTCAITSDGELYCWGNDTFGQLGNGSPNQDSSTPQLVGGVMAGQLAGQ